MRFYFWLESDLTINVILISCKFHVFFIQQIDNEDKTLVIINYGHDIDYRKGRSFG